MPSNRTLLSRFMSRTSLALVMGLPLVAASHTAHAQDSGAQVEGPLTTQQVEQLPPEYRTGPVVSEDVTQRSVGPDGVETITRTRRIESTGPAYPAEYRPMAQQAAPRGDGRQGYVSYAPAPYAPQPVVFEREQWLEECRRRTSGRDEREKGGIIGALLGAITGGIIGNRVADGERLGGTLIGVGTGGLAGLLLGNLIGGGKKNDRYDCEAALDSYVSQYGYPATGPARIASRTIPAAPAYAPAYAPPAYAPAYGYGYGYPAYQGYAYAPQPQYQPQQMVMVPMRYDQQQRVIVRETVREEMVPVPATRSIPAREPQPVTPVRPAPSAKMIKTAPAQTRPIKGE